MKPFTFAFAIVACTGMAFAQTPATTSGQLSKKQIIKQTPHKPYQAAQKKGVMPFGLGGNLALGVNVADDCAAAPAITGSTTLNFDTTGFTQDANGQSWSTRINSDGWLEYTASADGDLTISTCNDGGVASSSMDSHLALYDGAGCPGANLPAASNDDGGGCASFSSRIDNASVTAGSSYMIQIGGWGAGETGTGVMDIIFVEAVITTGTDDCGSGTPISGDGVNPFDATAATTGAEGQNEALCTSYGSTAVDNDVWFVWTADTNGTVNVSTCNDANDDTKIAAYAAGACPTDGSALACNDDGAGCANFTSSMDFACVSGTSYLIQVGHFPGTAGTTGNVTITQTYLPPVGETCANATTIAGDGSFAYDNSGNLTDLDGQNEGICYQFGSSAVDNDTWFLWTATANGTATMDTCGSVPDTKIAAFPGGGCPADETALACNDDTCGLQSQITFACTAGSSYLIECGNFPGTAGGATTLNVVQAASCANTADDCAAASAIAGQGVFCFDASSATTGAEGQIEYNCYSFGSSVVDNDVWMEWTADADGTATVSTCDDASADTKIAAYPGGGCPVDGTSLACNDDADGCVGFTSSMDFSVTNGSSYMIQVGHFPGTAGGLGNVTISIADPLPPHPLDECGNGATLAIGPNVIDSSGASYGSAAATDSGVGLGGDIWYDYTPSATGIVAFALCDLTGAGTADFDSIIAVLDACGGNVLGFNDDFCGLQSAVTVTGTAGVPMVVNVSGFGGATGTGVLSVIEILGTPYCVGDGSSTACPCGNNAPAGLLPTGCVNSAASAGTLLAAGTASVSGDTVQLIATGLVPSLPCLFFSGKNAVNGGAGITFGDGLRCAGNEAIRLQVTSSDATGNSITTSAVGGGLVGGDTRYYQCWYRDNTGVCGNSHNLTNGLAITWDN
jgi:hypothetical protein